MPYNSIYTMEDLIKPEKTVICRIDINSPLKKNGEILDKTRFLAHRGTIKWLIDNGNKVVLLAHQGRPGEPDFTNLKDHATVLSEVIGEEIKFVDDVIGKKAIEAIKNLKTSEIILLDNVRFVKDETKEADPYYHAENSSIVRALSPHGDYFILDGFAVSHRPHASVVGFAPKLPSAAGKLMYMELKNLYELVEKDSYCMVVGGAKIGDAVKYISKLIEQDRVSKIMLTGLTALVFQHVLGLDLPKPTKNLVVVKAKSYTEKIKKILDKGKDKIILPIDYAIDFNGKRKEIDLMDLRKYAEYPIKDIGQKTINYYIEEIKGIDFVIIKGPAGVIEEENFIKGSKKLLEGIFIQNKFIIFFGGHLISVLNTIDESIKKGKYYSSTGGGAAVHLITHKTLPGLEALIISKKHFS